MAARVSTSLSQGPPPLGSEAELSAGQRAVVSVSPRLAHAAVDDQDPDEGQLRFPLVETIRADHRAGDALVSLIEISRQTALGLRELIEQGRNCERKTTRSSLQLQERLRLSARMLQAFQLQIGRMEKGLADLQEHERSIRASQESITQRLEQLQSEARQFIAEAESRLAEVAKLAGARVGMGDHGTRAG
jgi:hypothetical protein